MRASSHTSGEPVTAFSLRRRQAFFRVVLPIFYPSSAGPLPPRREGGVLEEGDKEGVEASPNSTAKRDSFLHLSAFLSVKQVGFTYLCAIK
ncbi:hypothetical protein PIB30_046839 [Stylosanthes scabra]|uniref:Uncharacterized protein n=1 Tax=Stylosanthes scabra TaxID=79078 RepID=A0ABU6WGA0_9FABA|nr:hypothetical protein [Stylosanthes scabra]